MRVALVLALSVLMAGCLCGGGGVETTVTTETVEPTTTEGASETTLPTETTLETESTETTQGSPTTTAAPAYPDFDCSKLPTHADRDICVVTQAAVKRDASLCQKVNQQSVKRLCTSVLMEGKCTGFGNPGDRMICEAALSGDPDRCKALFSTDRDACYFMVAVFNRDVSACERAASAPGKALCYGLLGACSRLTDQKTLEYCEENVRKMTRF